MGSDALPCLYMYVKMDRRLLQATNPGEERMNLGRLARCWCPFSGAITADVYKYGRVGIAEANLQACQLSRIGRETPAFL